jgi:hypothetical protein
VILPLCESTFTHSLKKDTDGLLETLEEEFVGIGTGIDVGGTGVEAGAHPLNKTVRNTNARKTDPIDFFMTLSPFDLIAQDCAQLGVQLPFCVLIDYRLQTT